MQTSSESKALLNADLSAAITPAIVMVTASGATHPVPVTAENSLNGFALALNLALPYEALSNGLQSLLYGKRLQLTEGFLNQHLVLNGCRIYGAIENKLVAEVPFSGSYNGTFYISGSPVYNPESHHLELQEVGYDLQTKSLILKGAKWLFGKLLLEEIKKYTAIDLTTFYGAATARVNDVLNRAWATGVQANGKVTNITITSLTAQQNQLLVQAQCRGDLMLTISESELKF